MMIPLSVPYINKNEWKYVKNCLDSGWISSSGAYVNKFEEAIKNYTKSKNAVACMNGTAGLHTSLMLIGVCQNDLVLTTNLTFVATLNSIKYCGADPVLFDIDEKTWQIDTKILDEWLKNHSEIVFNNLSSPQTFLSAIR